MQGITSIQRVLTEEQLKKLEKIKKISIKNLRMQIAQENKISHDDVIFLDRAIPNALAYYRFMNLPEDKNFWKH